MGNEITDRRFMSKDELKKLLRYLEKDRFIKSLVFSHKKDAFHPIWWKISEYHFSEHDSCINKIQISFFEYPNDMYRAVVDFSSYSINYIDGAYVDCRKAVTSLDEFIKLLSYAEKVFDLYSDIYKIKP